MTRLPTRLLPGALCLARRLRGRAITGFCRFPRRPRPPTPAAPPSPDPRTAERARRRPASTAPHDDPMGVTLRACPARRRPAGDPERGAPRRANGPATTSGRPGSMRSPLPPGRPCRWTERRRHPAAARRTSTRASTAWVVRQSDRKDYAGPGLRSPASSFRSSNTADRSDRAARPIEAVPTRPGTHRLAPQLAPAFIVAGQRMVSPGNSRPASARNSSPECPISSPARSRGGESAMAGTAALARFIAARDATLATIAETRAYLDARAASWPDNYAIGKAAYERCCARSNCCRSTRADLERMPATNSRTAGRRRHGRRSRATQDAVRRRPAAAAWRRAGRPSSATTATASPSSRRSSTSHDVVAVPAWLGSMEIVETPAFLQPVSPGASMYSPRLFARSTRATTTSRRRSSLEDAARRSTQTRTSTATGSVNGAPRSHAGHFLQLSIARRHPDSRAKDPGSAYSPRAGRSTARRCSCSSDFIGDDLDARSSRRNGNASAAPARSSIRNSRAANGDTQAVDVLRGADGLPADAAKAAIAGIALGPGYVISYTVGRRSSRPPGGVPAPHRREGSLRDFHDRLLSYGSTPFAVVGPELLADLDKPASAVRAAANY